MTQLISYNLKKCIVHVIPICFLSDHSVNNHLNNVMDICMPDVNVDLNRFNRFIVCIALTVF